MPDAVYLRDQSARERFFDYILALLNEADRAGDKDRASRLDQASGRLLSFEMGFDRHPIRRIVNPKRERAYHAGLAWRARMEANR